MTTWTTPATAPARHPVLACAEVVEAAPKDVADMRPGFMTTGEKAEALLRLTALTGQVEALRLRVIAAADEVAADHGCRTVADWLASRTPPDRPACARAERLALAVDGRWPLVGSALAEGRVSIAQAEVIVAALDALPTEIGPELQTSAEERLVEEAERLDPAGLRRLAARLLELLAPDVADHHERRALEAANRRAEAATRLTLRQRGDGCTDLVARIPDATADRLRTHLEAFTAPRQAHVDGSAAAAGGWTDPATGIRLSPDRMAGEALCALLERLDPARLPAHGGTSATVTVTLSLDQLRDGIGVADTDRAGQVTAADARRLACTAGIIPPVLGTRSEVLDLGRTSRLFSAAQRKALAVGHPHCRAEGCTVPATWCEAHHAGRPWADGGRTDLADGLLLCHGHHKRAHDSRYQTNRHPTATSATPDAGESCPGHGFSRHQVRWHHATFVHLDGLLAAEEAGSIQPGLTGRNPA